MRCLSLVTIFFFFFNDTATTEIYTLSLHDALPISPPSAWPRAADRPPPARRRAGPARTTSPDRDRKSTRLNSSHGYISYAVFCLKKKKNAEYYLPKPDTPNSFSATAVMMWASLQAL